MKLHIESVGRGPPLVALHGWAMHSGLWFPVLAALAARFRVHCIDLPGHGYSPTVSPYTLAEVSAEIAGSCRELDEMPEGPLTVLGWSLGATIAMHWALTEPTRISALILTGATPCFVERPGWCHGVREETLRQFGDELDVAYRLTLQRFVSLQVQGGERPRETLAQLRGQLFSRGEPPRAALRGALDVLLQADLRRDVGAIEQPVLVISGTRDSLTPAWAGEWLAATLRRSAFTRIDGAAHAPFLSHPARFIEAIAHFSEQVPPVAATDKQEIGVSS